MFFDGFCIVCAGTATRTGILERGGGERKVAGNHK